MKKTKKLKRKREKSSYSDYCITTIFVEKGFRINLKKVKSLFEEAEKNNKKTLLLLTFKEEKILYNLKCEITKEEI